MELPILNNAGIGDYVAGQVEAGIWKTEVVPASVLGTPRDMTIYRAARSSNPIKHTWHGSTQTFCPPKWYDLGIGSGACGYGCRFCFLMLTFRAMRDPSSPVVYNNIDHFHEQVRRWLVADDWKTDAKTPLGDKVRRVARGPLDTLGLGIDCSDSLLFEGVTGHTRALIPMFANPILNPRGNKLILLTKSANTHYLEGLTVSDRVAVTFSLNSERASDAWEGKYSDGVRITPSIIIRLKACLHAQKLGYETRWRLDPILTIEGWKADYKDFFREAALMGVAPRYITLGTYRQKNAQLDTWRAMWGLPAPEWEPETVEHDGTHDHLLHDDRLQIYRTVMDLIEAAPWRGGVPRVELCKEPHTLRQELQIKGVQCNCLQ